MPKAAPKTRGRPRKPVGTTIDAADAPKRRGRPPKGAAGAGRVAAPSSTDKAAAAPPKRRGRPPKTATTTKTTASPAAVAKEAAGRVTKKTTAAAGRAGKSKAGTTKKKAQALPTGGYAVTCKAISEEWPDVSKGGLGLDISESSTPGAFEASFDFGVLEGVMVLSADEKLLEAHIKKLEDEDEDEDEDDDHGKASLQWRGVDTEATKFDGPNYGVIKFTSKTFKKFSGTVDLAFVGDSVEIKGERVTDESQGDASEWNDYGECRGEAGYGSYSDSNNWGHDRWGKWGYLGS